jgi:cyclohexanone monooxygenase
MSVPSTGPINPRAVDVIVVGAGFSGLHLTYELWKKGFSIRTFEAGSGVGGTWFWNRYPGARCDVESLQYSFSFCEELQQEWTWTQRYAKQEEILAYLEHVADRFELRSHIQLNTRVEAAAYNEDEKRWTVTTDEGATWSAKFFILACGTLTKVRLPDIPGIEDFKGRKLHTARWPSEKADFRGKRVGIIGTGSTAIQVIPEIAEEAAALTVFQRTANFVVPSGNRSLTAEEISSWKARYAQIRQEARLTRGGVYDPDRTNLSALQVGEEERNARYAAAWKNGGVLFQFAFNDIQVDEEANRTAADFVRARIRELVRDPLTAEDLCPNDHPISAKRLCVHSGYYETFNRSNVQLVNLRRNPIQRFTVAGARCSDGDIPLDILICATGFDAMTGSLKGMDIRGRGGVGLAEAWNAGPVTYLGLQVHGFPNLFLVTGPGSPSVLSNAVVSIEQHVEWIGRCLESLREAGKSTMEAKLDSQEDWVAHVNALADATLYPRANSWYNGANIPGKPRVFMPYVGGVGAYLKKCDEIAQRGYEGFVLN